MELSIVDPDIADLFRDLHSEEFVSGSAARLQIARSLRQIAAALNKRGEGYDGGKDCRKSQDRVRGEDAPT